MRLQGERLADIVLTPTEPTSPTAGARLVPNPGEGGANAESAMTLTLRDVVFRYARDEAPVLPDAGESETCEHPTSLGAGWDGPRLDMFGT